MKTPVAMPIKLLTVSCDDVGYPEWEADLRLNPVASVFDVLLSESGETDESVKKWWKAFGVLVVDWNFATTEGVPISLPSEHESEKALNELLPPGITTHLYRAWMRKVTEMTKVPKGPDASSSSTSSTSDEASTIESPASVLLSNTSPSSSQTASEDGLDDTSDSTSLSESVTLV